MFSIIHFERFLYHLLVASHSFPLTSRRPIEHRHASRRSHLSPLAWRPPSTFSPPPGRAPRRRPTRRTGWRRRTYWRGVVRRRTSGFTPSESSRTLSRAVSGRCRNDRRRWRAMRATLARGADDRRRRGWARFDARWARVRVRVSYSATAKDDVGDFIDAHKNRSIGAIDRS